MTAEGESTSSAEVPMQGTGVERDHFLQILAQSVARGELSVGLTVVVSGAVLSGSLITRTRWHELLAEATAGSTAGEFFQGFVDSYAEEPDTPPEDVRAYAYLHLSDVRMLSGAGPTEGLLMRVRISEVAAWSFQNIS